MSVLFWVILSLLSLALLGILIEQCIRFYLSLSASKDRTFVVINGKPLHYVKMGSGNCTVIFQSGMGSSHAIWRAIQKEISPNAVTITYDRNGIMHSPSNGLPVTNKQVSDELQTLLEKTNCPKPYIVVGHSMAGIYLRPFIENNKKDIIGIVFVEAAHPKQIKQYSKEILEALRIPPFWLVYLAVNSGLYRLLFSFLPISPEIPKNHWLHQTEKKFFHRSYRKTFEELDNDRSNMEDAERYGDFDDIPLIVIRGTLDIHLQRIKDSSLKEQFMRLTQNLQEDLLQLSSNSRLLEAPKSGHLVQINDSETIHLAVLQLLNLK